MQDNRIMTNEEMKSAHSFIMRENPTPKLKKHISVCICTYKRPKWLDHLLKKLQEQETSELFTYSIIIIDNDNSQSAKRVVENNKESVVAIDYQCEPEKNIARARNRAIQNATGDFVAFIDDDEFPPNDWLLNLLKSYYTFKANGVLGPVIPKFEVEPPDWVLKGRFCERPKHDTGTKMHWKSCRTGNVLLDRNVLDNNKQSFDPNFGMGGEDVKYFKDRIENGYSFIWCNEAPVYEIVPASRLTVGYFLRRAFLQGNISYLYHNDSIDIKKKITTLMKSSIATIIYTIILPFVFLAGFHHFIRYLIKDLHHISRLMTLFGVKKVKERNL